jgi:hypothetical protein
MAFVLHSFIRHYCIADIDFHIYSIGDLEISPISKNAIFLSFIHWFASTFRKIKYSNTNLISSLRKELAKFTYNHKPI